LLKTNQNTATPIEAEISKKIPLLTMLDGVESQSREAIEAAYADMKENPPFWI